MVDLIIDIFILLLTLIRNFTMLLTFDNPLLWKKFGIWHPQAEFEGPAYKLFPPRRHSKLHDHSKEEIKSLKLKSIKVYGQVVDFDTGKPLENAKLDFWQYHPLTGYSVFGYNFRGYFLTDKQGKCEIETLIPVPETSIRPSHIHVIVSSSGYNKLTTQLYVNPEIKTDFLNNFRPFPQHLVLAVEQTNKDDDIPQAKFTFRLKKK
ncbi:unnamed protein product [Didymodactylos carnosus]|uniref:Intradiol ring-cleavage dioxygenases domain-containing protein n=1 Tax=Didymodactylos carnosus TaxID=1234261 RepID=A0A8S2DLB6_9BILA|nr:unnamed protein product [Didymodactylos carnosus]CAF3769378.1 unnamed protein product [Didymodactylos carnosus]